MVMLGTVALTGYLYVVIPKGFFPQQDTGQIVGITEASEDISFPAMAQRQQALVNILLKDPAIELGQQLYRPRRPDRDAQPGTRLHSLEARQPARRERRPGHQPPAAATGQDPGDHALHAGRAGHHHRRAPVEDAVSIYPDRRRFDRACALVGGLRREDEGYSRDHGRRERPGQRRSHAQREGQSRGRLELRDPSIDDRQRARRRLWTAHRLDHLHAAQPVSCRARGRPALPVRPGGTAGYLLKLLERPAGAAQHPGAQQHQAGADRHQSSGDVPVGYHLLQSDAGRGAWRRGRGHPEDREADRQTGVARHFLSGQCTGFPGVALRDAVAGRCRIGGDLHHSGRSLRERHPPDHDPVHPAVGWHRRPAAADGGAHGPERDRHDRHHPADRHRQEKRHHAGRLRSRG